MIANVKLCQSSWPYGTHGSAAVCWGTSRLQYMVNTPDWSILYLECMFTTSHVPVLMLTCTHRPTYTISFFFFLKSRSHSNRTIVSSGTRGRRGGGTHTHMPLQRCAPSHRPLRGRACLPVMQKTELAMASGEFKSFWKCIYELFLSAVLLSRTWIVSIFYFRSRESSCNLFSEVFDETIHMNVYYTGVQYISSNSWYFF